MARTYRRVPPECNSWDRNDEDYKAYVESVKRGHVTMPLRHPDEKFEEVGGEKSKRWAKKRMSRKRRLIEEKNIREQMGDVDL